MPADAAPNAHAPLRAILPIAAAAALLLAVAAAALVVGVHDAALENEDVGVASISALLVLVAVPLAGGAVQPLLLARRRTWTDGVRPPCKLLVLVAFLLVILLGVYIFFSALRSGGAQRPVVLAVALVLVAGAVACLASFGRDAEKSLPRIGTIALGLVGTAIGALEFWYQNHYVPSHAGRAVSLSVSLRPEATRGSFRAVRATVSYEDVGGRSVAVIGSAYTLTGSHVVACSRAATTTRVQGVFNGFLPDPQRSRYMGAVWERRPPDILAAGKFVGDGKRLDPDVPAGRDFVFLVPPRGYQLLRFRAQLFAIPASVHLSQSALPTYTTFPGDHALYGFWRIDDASWLHDLVYGRDRWVVLRYELVDRDHKTNRMTSPDLRASARFPAPTWSEGRPDAHDVDRLFAKPQPSDASEPFADTELALDPVAPKTRRGLAGVPKACYGRAAPAP
jgi:hypothetical protein